MSVSSPPDEHRDEQQSPWSRPSILISGAFLLLLILAGLIIAIAGGGSHHAGTTPTTQLTAGKTSPSPAASPTACTLPAGNQIVPYTSPPEAQWQTVGSMEAPQSPNVYGPQHTSGIWNTCFAHNPSGALLAAMNLWAEGTAVPPSQLFRRLAVGAPKNLGNNDQLGSNGPVQIAGYQYGSYTPSEAQLSIVLKGPQGKLLAIVTPMVWRNDDWKYLFPAGGTPAMEVLSDLTGYVQWSSF